MVSAPLAGLGAVSVAVTATQLLPFLKLQPPSGTQAAASTLDDDAAVQALLALTATTVLCAAVAAVIRLHRAGAAANKRLSELAMSILCGAAGALHFILFGQPVGAVDDVGALARALGRAALKALPAAAAVVFFLGISLLIAHIRAGGEGGGTAVADNTPRVVPVPVRVLILKKIALGAAAALLCQIAMAALYVM